MSAVAALPALSNQFFDPAGGQSDLFEIAFSMMVMMVVVTPFSITRAKN